MKDNRITSGKYNQEMDTDEKTLRPLYLSEFIGQDKLKDNLFVFITAAKERGESLDHVFFSGPPGLGKTTLSGIIAHELGVAFRATSAPALEKQGDLAAILTTIGEKNVFFIDEIHRLKPQVEEILYSAMEDFEIDVIIGQGPGARTIKIPIPRFTLVGATTKTGLVSGPLYSRFGITARLDFYTTVNIKKIVYRSSQILGITIDDDAAEKIAVCSRGTPRIANRLLRRMRDFAQVRGDGKITKEIVDNGLLSLEIDERGLDKVDRKILITIIRNYSGGPVGSETLAISIHEAVDTLEDVYEPYLIQEGFLQRTSRGRMATELAYQHLGLEYSGNEDQGLLF
ncbi:MAG: Holliday junction branch migration DNA helicase RuvB [Spirochaetales bacterium]|nr:Holliday junction branch migration DNA helicase RuvB [Spirochaetales bacterium]